MPQVTGAARKLGIWQCVGVHHTCVFPIAFEPPRHLVAEIRKFDPWFVPICVIKEYVAPTGGTHTFVFYSIGRWAPYPDDAEMEPVKVERPSDFPFHGGVIYEQRLWADPVTPEGRKLGLPEKFRPFDMRLVKWMDAAHREMLREDGSYKWKVQRAIDGEYEAEQAALEKIDAEKGYQLRHTPIVRAIETGNFVEKPKDPKPFVQVTQEAASAPPATA